MHDPVTRYKSHRQVSKLLRHVLADWCTYEFHCFETPTVQLAHHNARFYTMGAYPYNFKHHSLTQVGV